MEETNFLGSNLTKERDEKTAVYIIHRAYVIQKKNKWQHTASTKTRSEVAGGGRKPWKQKGTGRARAGSNTSPLWKGGGVTFGPKAKEVKYKLNRKEKQLALKLMLQAKQAQFKVVENLEGQVQSPKTRDFLHFLESLGLSSTSSIGLILPRMDANLVLATRNLKNIRLMLASSLNVADLLRAEHLITTQEALTYIHQFYSKV